ncbi:MAG: PIN domain-containing protein [Streptosporangiales bacterium]|nr:PIN domain-containing protein [Streptosporangiales bacterium]
MGLIVVDASVVVDLLAGDDTPRRKAASERLTGGHALYAPAHLDIEVISALRGIARYNPVLAADAPMLLGRLPRMPIRREPVTDLAAHRIWQLRENMTAYDAGYVALAEHLGAGLLTCDGKYAAITGLRCAIELLA